MFVKCWAATSTVIEIALPAIRLVLRKNRSTELAKEDEVRRDVFV
jgi:hypothetical protein